MFFSCLKKSINDVIEVINKINDNNEFEKHRFELFYKIVIAVHFIADYEVRIKKHIPLEYKDFVMGFHYLNNQLKHDCNLEIIYYEVCGSMFPLRYLMQFGKPGVCWNNFVDNSDKKSRDQRKYYEEHLMNQDIETTFRHIWDIFNEINNNAN